MRRRGVGGKVAVGEEYSVGDTFPVDAEREA
jgi:hypothetical protein